MRFDKRSRNGPPKCYGYIRETAAFSHESQKALIEGYYRHRQMIDKEAFGKAGSIEIYCEPKSLAAFRRPFSYRPAGSKLKHALRSGDHIICASLWTVWNGLEAFILETKGFFERNVAFHFVDFMGCSVDTSSVAGKLVVNQACMLTEMRRRAAKENVRVYRQRKKPQQIVPNDGAPHWLMRRLGPKGERRLSFWPDAVEMMKQIVEKRDRGYRWSECSRNWALAGKWERAKYAYIFYKSWEAAGFPDINTIRRKQMMEEWWVKNKPEKANE